MKKTISFVGSVGIPASYGGFETLVEQLSLKLNKDFNIRVFCSGKHYNKPEQLKSWNNIDLHYIPLKANGIWSILYDLISFIKAKKHSDIVVVLGGSAGLFFPLFKIGKKIKIIFHPDGEEWKRKKWNNLTKLYLYYSIQTACRIADKIIIDNKSLFPAYSKYNKKLVYCSYGGDQYQIQPTTVEGQKYWLTIARAEPENNLNTIAESFSKLKSENWVLISNYKQTKFGRNLFNQYAGISNIKFISADYSKEVSEKYLNNCKAYIHGHSAGGTNPTLTVAMRLNKPLICHNNIYNRETTKNQAFFFTASKTLYEQINNTNLNSEILQEKARIIAEKNYTWHKVATVYKNLFNSISKI